MYAILFRSMTQVITTLQEVQQKTEEIYVASSKESDDDERLLKNEFSTRSSEGASCQIWNFGGVSSANNAENLQICRSKTILIRD